MAENYSHTQFLATVVDAAKRAGEIIRNDFYNTKHVKHKGQLFTGIRGQGAFLDGKPIKVSSQCELVKCLLATEAGMKRDKATLDTSKNRSNSLLYKVQTIRMSGSCALNLCGIVCGRLDLFYELAFGGPWDTTRGVVIVREAGGFVSSKDFHITAQRVAASNPLLNKIFLDALKQSE